MAISPDNSPKVSEDSLRFLQERKCLLLENNNTTRSAQKKILMNLGFDHKNILYADNYNTALKVIESDIVSVVIADLEFFAGSSFSKVTELYEKHLSTMTNRLETAFILVAEKGHHELPIILLENEIDQVVYLPFSGENFETSVRKVLEQKVNPSLETKLYCKAQTAYWQKKHDLANDLINELFGVNENFYEAHCLMGDLVLQMTNDPLEACFYYEEALHLKSDYYPAIKKLAELYYDLKNYERAYSYYLNLMENFPFFAPRLPRFIRLAILTHHYEDILHFSLMFKSAKLFLPAESLRAIAAGLTICGKQLLLKKEDTTNLQALEALRLASKLAEGKKEIIHNIVHSLVAHGYADEALKMLDEAENASLPEEDLLLMQLEAINVASPDPLPVLQLGHSIIMKNIRTVALYKIMIERSIEAKRTSNAVEILVQEAKKFFPDQEESWNRFSAIELNCAL